MSEPTSDPKLVALEKSLAALVPAPGRIDRDQLLYRAGQASVRPRPWLWPTTTGLFAIVATILGTALAVQSRPAPVERIVYVSVPQPAAQTKTEPMSSGAPTAIVSRSNSSGLDSEDSWPGSIGYLKERNLVVRWGADALPPPVVAPTVPSLTVENLLGLPEKKPDQSGLFPLKF